MDRNWQEIFPRSVEFLNQRGQSNLLVEFETELEAQTFVAASSNGVWPFYERARWFPAFLKIKSCPTYWLEIAEFEYLQFAAKNVDFGSPNPFPKRLCLHPSAQFVELRHDHSELNRTRGLYCFVKRVSRFFELQLSLHQALILDLVQQDFVQTKEALLSQVEDQMANISPSAQMSLSHWREIFDQLVEIGILVEFT